MSIFPKSNCRCDKVKTSCIVHDLCLFELQAPEQLSDGEELTKEPALLLKYIVHKHLAEIAEVECKTEKILDHLLEVCCIFYHI